jgi:hypothetical protein
LAGSNLRELRKRDRGCHLFVPLILLQTIGSSAFALGPFGPFVLHDTRDRCRSA